MQPPSGSSPHSTTPSWDEVRFSLVGPGNVGSSLTAWLAARGAHLVAVAGGSRGPELARRYGASWCPTAELRTEGQDLLLVAVPDPVLTEVAGTLAQLPQARVALHTSGGTDAEALATLRESGTAVGSVHPLKAFPAPEEDAAAASGVFFAVDGDADALAVARRLVAAWQGRCFELSGDRRISYHLAARLAAGGVATLLSAAEEIAEQLQLPREAMAGYLALAHGALDRVAASEPAPRAITGPVARGEISVLELQKRALGELLPALSPAVEALDEETRRQLRRLQQGPFSDR